MDKINVTISGKTYDATSGGGLFQSEEYDDIAQAFNEGHRVRRGFGYQMTAALTVGQVRRLESHLQGYGEFFTGGGFDSDDYETPREGRACLKDAAKMREQLAAIGVAPVRH